MHVFACTAPTDKHFGEYQALGERHCRINKTFLPSLSRCVWKQSQGSVARAVSSPYTPGCLIIRRFSSQFSSVWRYKKRQTKPMCTWDKRQKMREDGEPPPESIWVVLCFTSPSFVNSGCPERSVAQRGHSGSWDSLITLRENSVEKLILLDCPHWGFPFFVSFPF